MLLLTVLMGVSDDGFYLAFWRPGDKLWTTSESLIHGICDVNFYQGKFYAICYSGDVWVWDGLELTVAQPKLIMNAFVDLFCKQLYLVVSWGELLVVVRNPNGEEYGVTIFSVLQLDVLNRQYKEIRSLENNAIFVGNNAAFSIDVTDATNWIGGQGIIEANSIYFCDDCAEEYWFSELGGGKDMGVYQLEDTSIQRFYGVNSYSLICPPLWVSPSN